MATFNILGFNQKSIVDIQNEKQINLNGNDLIVLRNIVDIIESKRLAIKVIDGKQYTWIKYSLLAENLFFVSDKEDTFKKIVTKLLKCGLLERIVLKSVGNGAYTYFRKTDLLEKILYTTKHKENLKNKSSNKEKVIENNSEALEEKIIAEELASVSLVKRLINETSESEKRVEMAINYAKSKNAKNIYLYAKETIKNNWDKENKYFTNNKNGFNNFKPREYDYEYLEKRLLGWE